MVGKLIIGNKLLQFFSFVDFIRLLIQLSVKCAMMRTINTQKIIHASSISYLCVCI